MSHPLDRTLRTTHRTVLVMIAACALLCAFQPRVGKEPAPDPTTTTVAVALALGSIVCRRASTSRVIPPGTRVTLLACTWACGFAIALLGAFLALEQERTRTGLLFCLAAAIFCLRPAPPVEPSG